MFGCLELAPALVRFAAEFEERVTLRKVHLQQQASVAKRFDVAVAPTVILFCQGAERWRMVGVTHGYEDLVEDLEGHLDA